MKPNSLTNSGSMPETDNNTFRNERNAVLSQDDVHINSNPASNHRLNSSGSFPAVHTPTEVKKQSTSSDRYMPSSLAIPERKSSPSSSSSSCSSSSSIISSKSSSSHSSNKNTIKPNSSSLSDISTPKKSRSKSEELLLKQDVYNDPAIISISECFENQSANHLYNLVSEQESNSKSKCSSIAQINSARTYNSYSGFTSESESF